jgi:hypothetical protein
VAQYIIQQIKEQRQTYDKNHIRSFVDIYIKEENEQTVYIGSYFQNLVNSLHDINDVIRVRCTGVSCNVDLFKYCTSTPFTSKNKTELHDIIEKRLAHNIHILFALV